MSKQGEGPRIALVGAGGMAFGPVMVLDAVRAKKIRGATLTLIDVDEKRLDICHNAAVRLNEGQGNPISIEKTTELDRGVAGADFVLTSAEFRRWEFWKIDYEVPRRHGSTQIMGENGGPGGVFHALRSIKNIIEICRVIEREAPDAYVLNLTNPMNPVTLAICRGTKLKNVGLCHELVGGRIRIAAILLMPVGKVHGEAFGMNHFTWFYKVEHRDTGEDLYPLIRRHFRFFGRLHEPLVRYTFKKYGLLTTSTDSHIGEYLPYASEVNRHNFPYYRFFGAESKLRVVFTRAFGEGKFRLPVGMLPKSGELPFPIIEALWSGDRTHLPNVVVPNRGYTPNLPDGGMVEVAAYGSDAGIEPVVTPPMPEELAELIRVQHGIQGLIVDAALNGDRAAALEAVLRDPLSPPPAAAREMFEEMCGLQEGYLPF